MAKVINLEQIHADCAGIDVGSRAIFVSPDGRKVVSFPTFTADYYRAWYKSMPCTSTRGPAGERPQE
ncbi:MAG: hypothetical protein LBH90_00510 [Tannerella sp.]|jgi:hypothetical protein|nr:hypothetical protein [Tannerella sp.]